MKLPPLLLAAGLLFWGVVTGFPLIALALMLAMESPRWIRARWDFDPKDYERVADLCSVAFLLLMVWQWFGTRQGPEGILTVLGWLPMIFAPVLLLQRYGVSGGVPLSALFWSLRRGRSGGVVRTLPLDHGYFAVCLLSATCANLRAPWFFPVLAGLGLYALAPLRPRGRSMAAWLPAVVCAVAIAYGLQHGLLVAQRQVEAFALDFLRDRVFGRVDPYRAQTSIGDLGRVKLSDRIVVRVGGPGARPMRLRDAVYDAFAHDAWFARSNAFRDVATEGDRGWRIAPGSGPEIALSMALVRGRGVLPLPANPALLDHLNVSKVERNPLGTVRVQDGPAALTFTVAADAAGVGSELGPTPVDLQMPERLRPVLMETLARWNLADRPGADVARALPAAFARDYRYTTLLTDAAGRKRSIEAFLTDQREGHCEYFATSTVLLLRAAGVPARYVTGYAVREWSAFEGEYRVRARHAHAWALAWIDGGWREIDSTPAGWFDLEAESASVWQDTLDLLSWMHHRWNQWRDRDPGPSEGVGLGWLAIIVPLAGWLVWSVTRRSRRDVEERRSASRTPDRLDHAMAPLLARLATLGHARDPSTPLRAWLRGLPLDDVAMQAAIRRIADEHARLRFDPDAADDAQIDALAVDATALSGRLVPSGAAAASDATPVIATSRR
ncbi:MAG: transglutaminase domain-containing protein [Burkholderiales bacterium]|nr:transglutaminase domain-containing protein [Burkholderiales bacterium]